MNKKYYKQKGNAMEEYNENKDYLGPEGSPISKYIPKAPVTVPQLRESFSKAAYNHDDAFEGSEFYGFWGWIRKWKNRKKVEAERGEADKKLRDDMTAAYELIKKTLTRIQQLETENYIEAVYEAVHNFGWSFYKNQKPK